MPETKLNVLGRNVIENIEVKITASEVRRSPGIAPIGGRITEV
jgi:hypothetical protein